MLQQKLQEKYFEFFPQRKHASKNDKLGDETNTNCHCIILISYLSYKKGASSIIRIEGDTVSSFHSCFEKPQNCNIRCMPDKLCHISSKIFAQYWLFIRALQKLRIIVNFILDFFVQNQARLIIF